MSADFMRMTRVAETVSPSPAFPYLSPVPSWMRDLLPPVPPQYAMGYYDGYVVVYDPMIYWIADVVDLLGVPSEEAVREQQSP
jgi:hypothetical protein